MKTSDEPVATPMSKSVVKRLEAQGAPLATKAVQTCVICGHAGSLTKNGFCYEQVLICDDPMHGTRGCGCKCVFSAPEAQTERLPRAGGEPELPQIIERGQLLDMIWANEAGISINVYDATNGRRVIEIVSGIGSRDECIMAKATIERHNRDPFASLISTRTSQSAGSPSDERLRYQVANLIEGVFSGVERQAMPPQQLLVLQENVFIALRAAYHSAPSPTTTDARQRAREIVDAVNKMYDIEPSGDDSCWAEYDRALVNSIASAISSSDKVKQPWQPIETAPKGRAAILVFCPAQHQFGSAIYLVYRFEGENRFRLYASGGRWFSHTPTHWMPLPEPPELSRERINNDHQSHP